MPTALEEMIVALKEVVIALKEVVITLKEVVITLKEVVIALKEVVIALREMAVAFREMVIALKEMAVALKEMSVAFTEKAISVKEMAISVEHPASAGRLSRPSYREKPTSRVETGVSQCSTAPAGTPGVRLAWVSCQFPPSHPPPHRPISPPMSSCNTHTAQPREEDRKGSPAGFGIRSSGSGMHRTNYSFVEPRFIIEANTRNGFTTTLNPFYCN